MNFTFEGLKAAQSAIERLTIFLQRLSEANGEPTGEELKKLMKTTKKDFEAALDDDLNITKALATLFDFIRDINRMMDKGKVSKSEAETAQDLMMRFDRILAVMGEVNKELLPKDIENLIQQRETARKAKNWKTADEIRQTLYEMGIILEDTKTGVRWRKKN